MAPKAHAPHPLRVRRIYDPPQDGDGLRVLVDRLWPRGLSRERAAIDLWLKDVAPSADLRKWFGHDPARWEEFRHRYRAELKGHSAEISQLLTALAKAPVTLLYAAHDEAHNNAIVLAEYLQGIAEGDGNTVGTPLERP